MFIKILKERVLKKIVHFINLTVVHHMFYANYRLLGASIFIDVKRPVRLWDFCFLFPDMLLFIGLALLLLKASLQLREINNKNTLILTGRPIEILNTYFRAAQTLLTGSTQFVTSVIRLLWLTLFFLLINPMGWMWQKYMCYGLLMTSPFIVFVKVLIIFISIICFKSNYIYFSQETNRSVDFPVLLGFIPFVLLLLIQVHDFFLLFLLFELLAMIFYVVFAVRRASANITYIPPTHLLTRYRKVAVIVGAHKSQMISGLTASLTYLLSNVFITGIYLFGVICLFLICQSTVFPDVAFILTRAILNSNHFIVVWAIFGVLIVFLFKLASVPFHWWIPAVFEGAPLVALMFLAIPVKIVIILLLMKILQGVFFCMVWFWQPLLVITSLLSMIIGACALVLQTNLKKFWAYSTINHMGYILLGLSTDTFMGLRAVLIYLIGYILMNLCFFIIIVALHNDVIQQRILVINQFSLLLRFRYSLLGVFMAILIFSLIGVPPFVGFWGKYFVLMAINSAYMGNILIIILIVAVITTLITTVGYLKIWRSIYMEQTSVHSNIVFIQPIPIYNLQMVFRISFFIAFGGVLTGIFIEFFYDFLDVFIWGFIETVPYGKYFENISAV